MSDETRALIAEAQGQVNHGPADGLDLVILALIDALEAAEARAERAEAALAAITVPMLGGTSRCDHAWGAAVYDSGGKWSYCARCRTRRAMP